MADLTFDAVICGGGNKALMLAMYLSQVCGHELRASSRDGTKSAAAWRPKRCPLPAFEATPTPTSSCPGTTRPSTAISRTSGSGERRSTSIAAATARSSWTTKPASRSTVRRPTRPRRGPRGRSPGSPRRTPRRGSGSRSCPRWTSSSASRWIRCSTRTNGRLVPSSCNARRRPCPFSRKPAWTRCPT